MTNGHDQDHVKIADCALIIFKTGNTFNFDEEALRKLAAGKGVRPHQVSQSIADVVLKALVKHRAAFGDAQE